jgi:pimeloyl-[acyl-carrier protein] methyl ester esterase
MTLNIECFGRGAPVAFLHGWGMHSEVWRSVAQEFARRFQVHLVDLPGHGKSSGEELRDIEAAVHALAAALQRRISLIGWSLGATVALVWAKSRPEQVRALALVAATPCFVTRDDWVHGWPRHQFESFERDVRRDAGSALKRFLSLQTRGDEAERQILRELRQTVFDTPRPELTAGLEILRETDLREVVPLVQQPALLIHGDSDSVVPVDAAQWLVHRLPDATLQVFPRCGHAPFLSRPREFVREVADFFDARSH